jgi:T4-like virus Myoviridae tail sheath stabiliser
MPELNSRLQAIRKTTVAFASLFKDIPFIIYNDQGIEQERIKVPIVYGNKEKYVKRLEAIDEKVQITLPRIEYGLLNIQYDASRRTNQSNKITGCASTGAAYVNSPTPYNFNFELVIYTRNVEDANQIIEYIMPFFYPDYNIKVNFVPELSISKTVPVTFNGESQEEDSTGVFDSPVRSVFRTLSFTARSFIYPPPKYLVPILQAETNIYIPNSKKEFVLSNGYGHFAEGEFVYQGTSYDRATARAKVYKWNPTSNTIQLIDITGDFKANSRIYNPSRSKQYNVLGLPASQLALESIITPVPNTYPVTGPYDYNIIINDYTE